MNMQTYKLMKLIPYVILALMVVLMLTTGVKV